MTNTLKESIQNNLEVKSCNMGSCVVALNLQGYIVNARKKFKLKMNLVLQEQMKYIDSFTEETINRVINLFNSIS